MAATETTTTEPARPWRVERSRPRWRQLDLFRAPPRAATRPTPRPAVQPEAPTLAELDQAGVF